MIKLYGNCLSTYISTKNKGKTAKETYPPIRIAFPSTFIIFCICGKKAGFLVTFLVRHRVIVLGYKGSDNCLALIHTPQKNFLRQFHPQLHSVQSQSPLNLNHPKHIPKPHRSHTEATVAPQWLHSGSTL